MLIYENKYSNWKKIQNSTENHQKFILTYIPCDDLRFIYNLFEFYRNDQFLIASKNKFILNTFQICSEYAAM